MKQPELEVRVMRAVDMMYARESVQFIKEASEWAIAHRLAVYLEQEFPSWNVDCEYNRQGFGNNTKANTSGDKVRPDISLHHRGLLKPRHNLLAIEVKKFAVGTDLGKVREYTKPPAGDRNYQYQFGLALSSVVKGPTLHWFKKGKSLAGREGRC